ncbi:MAG: hypothetical protein NUW37_02065 [Planctomycetes bacterium]|nr:hypothetical protein [Planctomycetota bacterium]
MLLSEPTRNAAETGDAFFSVKILTVVTLFIGFLVMLMVVKGIASQIFHRMKGSEAKTRYGVITGTSTFSVGLLIFLIGATLFGFSLFFTGLTAFTSEQKVAHVKVYYDSAKNLTTLVFTPYDDLGIPGEPVTKTSDAGARWEIGGEVLYMQPYLQFVGVQNLYHISDVIFMTDYPSEQNPQRMLFDSDESRARNIAQMVGNENTFPNYLWVDEVNNFHQGSPIPKESYDTWVEYEMFARAQGFVIRRVEDTSGSDDAQPPEDSPED